MTQAIVFVSRCPSCKREQPQDAFTIADLVRLLNGGYPIEAYCVPCDRFWSISVQERVEVGEAVAVVYKGTLRSAEADYLRQRPSKSGSKKHRPNRRAALRQ